MGDGSLQQQRIPIQVQNLTDVVAVSAGASHTVALRNDGTVWAWGSNFRGNLGDGTNYRRTTPVQAKNLDNIIAISAFYNTIALRYDGTVWAVGSNVNGQLGNGGFDARFTFEQVHNLENVMSISAGESHVLALRKDRVVWGWGSNSSGQLDVSIIASHRLPVRARTAIDAVAIAAGRTHSTMIREDSTAWAWGDNFFGNLGDGTTIARRVPVQVYNLQNIAVISAGRMHTVALQCDGTVWAWGANDNAQLGDGTTSDSLVPVPVRNPGGVGLFNLHVDSEVQELRHISHAHNLVSEVLFYIHPQNIIGGEVRNVIVDVIEPMTGVAVSNYAIGIGNFVLEGIEWANAGDTFSANTKYTLDITLIAKDGYFFSEEPIVVINNYLATVIKNTGITVTLSLEFPETESAMPYYIYEYYVELNENDNRVISEDRATVVIDREDDHFTYAYNLNIMLRDYLYSERLLREAFDTTIQFEINELARYNEKLNQLTNSLMVDTIVTSPYRVDGLYEYFGEQSFIEFEPFGTSSGGHSHNVVVKNDGTVWTWGRNNFGQLGDGTTIDRNTPVKVSTLTNVIAVAGGDLHTVALREDGTVWAWGLNSNGFLGDGTRMTRHTPVQVLGITDVVAIAAGHEHTIALKEDGTVWAWGSNFNGQLGDGTTLSRIVPTKVQGIDGVAAISAGSNNSIAIRFDGTVWTWGSNRWGQLGDGTTTNRNTPTKVSNMTDVVDVVTGTYSMAVLSDGTVWAWGLNSSGQLGKGTTINQYKPVRVEGITNIISIASSSSHSIALGNDETLWVWGNNGFGQLGDGTTLSRRTPVQMQNLNNIVEVATGNVHSIAVNADGYVWAWGYNRYGQLGDGTRANRHTPIQVLGSEGQGWLNIGERSRPQEPQPPQEKLPIFVRYEYRADGLRHSKTVDGDTITHVWRGAHIVLELDGSGAIINRFDRSLTGRLIRSEQHGYYLHNKRGDVVQRVNAQGIVLHVYRYTAFGVEIGDSNVSKNPFRFASMYWDAETGTYYTPNRHFNPRTGRWTQPDPAFWGPANIFACHIQAGNLYLFVMHNPVMFTDPLGLFAIIRNSSGNYRIEAVTDGDALSRTLRSAFPVVGQTWGRNPSSRVQNLGDFIGEAHWNISTGTVFSLDTSMVTADLIAGGVISIADGIIQVALGAKYGATIAMSALTFASANQQIGYSNAIIGLMEVHGVSNDFSDLQSLIDQVATFDSIIMNNPNYFFAVSPHWPDSPLRGTFQGSAFKDDLRLFRMDETRRSNAFRVQEGRGPSDWTTADFNRANNALLERLRRTE